MVNKFLLIGDKFMPELHLKQPGFTYSVCGPFTKNCGRIQKFRETGNLKHLYRNELDKACFAHDGAQSDRKDLAKRTISDIEIVITTVIKKFRRAKVYVRFKENIWAADLAEMGLLSSKNKNVKCLLCAIDAFTKYALIKPLKDKRS